MTIATYQRRLVDIGYYLPWSRSRQKKKAFYSRIRAAIGAIDDLDSIESAVKRLSETFDCPVALVGARRPVVAGQGATEFDWRLAPTELRSIPHMVVRNELADTRATLQGVMKRHGIAAIVPFFPHARQVSGWLLLGDPFSDRVYSARDFRAASELFDRTAELFLDKLFSMRSQLHELVAHTRALEQTTDAMRREVAQLREENQALLAANTRLAREQAVDSIESAVSRTDTGALLTFIGRDGDQIKRLRAVFPQLAHHRSMSAPGFKRQASPDVLLVSIEAESAQKETRALVDWMRTRPSKSALLLSGAGAPAFSATHKNELRRRLCEVMPTGCNDSTWERRVSALVELQRALIAIPLPDTPLLGRSPPFLEHMEQVRQLASVTDPLVLRHDDADLARALALHIHELSGCKGAFGELRLRDMPADESAFGKQVDSVLRSVRDGSLLVEGMPWMPASIQDRLLDAVRITGEVRLIASCDQTTLCDCEPLLLPFRPLCLDVPGLRKREQDLTLLVHYFTLQFNLQTGESRYVRQAEFEQLRAANPATIAALKQLVFTLLGDPAGLAVRGTSDETAPLVQPAGDRTLDEHVAEFEARIILDAIARCGGNKAKAARLLGVRPNTLHYKLERHGLKDSKA